MSGQSPWNALTASIKKLADRLDAQPVVREATLMSSTAVRFDIDTVNTLIHGNLAGGAPVGSRVLTLTLRHYIWVLGVKGGASPYQPPAVPFFLALKASAVSIPNSAFTAVNLSAADEYLEFAGVSVNGATITIQKAGVYTLYGAVKWASNTAGNSRGIAFLISDYPAVQQAENNQRANGYIAAALPVTTSWTGPLAAGCTIRLAVTQNSGAALNADRVELGISYIGPRA